MRRTPLIAIAALSCALAFAGEARAAPVPANERLATKLADAVNADNAFRHLRALQRIADANHGHRNAGTPGHEASARYIADQLEAAGYEPKLQAFSFTDFEFSIQTLRQVTPAPRTLSPLMARFSPPTPPGGISALLAVVAAGPPADTTPGCEAADYAGGDVKGRIALIKAGGCSTTLKQRTAAEAGAVAALIDTDSPAADMNLRSRLAAADARIPTATLSRREAEELAGAGNPTLHLELRGHPKHATTMNVIVDTPTGRSDNLVVVGGHLDGVTEGPGINDNGSGSAMILETALRLVPHWQEVRNKVRFAWWSAEEHGLLGSAHYVEQLSFAERLDTAMYLNYDMIGSPNFSRMVYDGDDSEHEGSGPGPYGSAAIEKVYLDYFAKRGLRTIGRDFDGRSDYGSFIDVGIPAGGATSGSNLVKRPAWAELFGGVAGQPLDSCYHSPCDTLANVDRTIFDEIGDAVAFTAGRFAVDASDVTGVAMK